MLRSCFSAATLGLAIVLASPAVAKTKIGIVVETLGNPYFACLKKAAEQEAASTYSPSAPSIPMP